jgi:hypothetical protein
VLVDNSATPTHVNGVQHAPVIDALQYRDVAGIAATCSIAPERGAGLHVNSFLVV